MSARDTLRALAAVSRPALVNRFGIAEVALSGRFIIGDPCALFEHDKTRMEFHRAVALELRSGPRHHRATCPAGRVTFRNIEFVVVLTDGDGWFYGVPVDTACVVACDLRALASAFGRAELTTI